MSHKFMQQPDPPTVEELEDYIENLQIRIQELERQMELVFEGLKIINKWSIKVVTHK